jgi:diguanylate cyclase (GGDEF)-like protein/PAS domain S-box-containing protein
VSDASPQSPLEDDGKRQRQRLDELRDRVQASLRLALDGSPVLGALLKDLAAYQSELAAQDRELGIVRGEVVGTLEDCRQICGGVTLPSAGDAAGQPATEARLSLAMQVFSQASEGIVVTDAANRITSVNRAFEQITGYTEQQALGRNPSFLSSGRHEKAFYDAMWKALLEDGRWQGEVWNRRPNGELYTEWLTLSRVRSDDDMTVNHAGVFSDISGRKLAEEEIQRLAYFDTLTGAPNRHLLRDRVTQAARQATREKGRFVLMFLDLDRFKDVNDTLGHDIGDLLLVEVAQRLRAVVRDVDTVSRIGGDEFVLLLPGAEQEAARALAGRTLQALTAPFDLRGHVVAISASIGMAVFPEDGTDATELLKNADTAMYQAKAAGRSDWRFFNPAMAAEVTRRSALAGGLRTAIASRELRMTYQPQVELGSGRLIGAEALLCWDNAALGNPRPGEFIPVAEENGLILSISQWVLREVLRQANEWRAARLPGFMLSINLAASHFAQPDLWEQVHAELTIAGWPANQLELEITERLAMKDASRSLAAVHKLRQSGVRFAIDDFGTGYSSLTNLRDLPVDTLKLDQTFIAAIGRGGRDELVLASILSLADTLGYRSVAEGVETAAQARFLTGVGCVAAQGYLYAHPMPPARFADWVAGYRPGQGDGPPQA